MKIYTSPKLLVLGSVANETLASVVVLPVPKCAGNTDSQHNRDPIGGVC